MKGTWSNPSCLLNDSSHILVKIRWIIVAISSSLKLWCTSWLEAKRHRRRGLTICPEPGLGPLNPRLLHCCKEFVTWSLIELRSLCSSWSWSNRLDISSSWCSTTAIAWWRDPTRQQSDDEVDETRDAEWILFDSTSIEELFFIVALLVVVSWWALRKLLKCSKSEDPEYIYRNSLYLTGTV